MNIDYGDILCIRKKFYYHYAIYISPKEIVHFSATSNKQSQRDYSIHTETTYNYMDKSVVTIIPFKALKNKQPLNIIIHNANTKLGKKGYNFIFNNCAHFVCECIWGTRHFAVLRLIFLRVKNRCNNLLLIQSNCCKSTHIAGRTT